MVISDTPRAALAGLRQRHGCAHGAERLPRLAHSPSHLPQQSWVRPLGQEHMKQQARIKELRASIKSTKDKIKAARVAGGGDGRGVCLPALSCHVTHGMCCVAGRQTTRSGLHPWRCGGSPLCCGAHRAPSPRYARTWRQLAVVNA